MTTFNFKQFLDNKKIERKYITSSTNNEADFVKILDAFTEKSDSDIVHLKHFMKDIDTSFKSHVLKYRKLKCDEVKKEEVMNANIYLGQEAKDIG